MKPDYSQAWLAGWRDWIGTALAIAAAIFVALWMFGVIEIPGPEPEPTYEQEAP